MPGGSEALEPARAGGCRRRGCGTAARPDGHRLPCNAEGRPCVVSGDNEHDQSPGHPASAGGRSTFQLGQGRRNFFAGLGRSPILHLRTGPGSKPRSSLASWGRVSASSGAAIERGFGSGRPGLDIAGPAECGGHGRHQRHKAPAPMMREALPLKPRAPSLMIRRPLMPRRSSRLAVPPCAPLLLPRLEQTAPARRLFSRPRA